MTVAMSAIKARRQHRRVKHTPTLVVVVMLLLLLVVLVAMTLMIEVMSRRVLTLRTMEKRTTVMFPTPLSVMTQMTMAPRLTVIVMMQLLSSAVPLLMILKAHAILERLSISPPPPPLLLLLERMWMVISTMHGFGLPLTLTANEPIILVLVRSWEDGDGAHTACHGGACACASLSVYGYVEYAVYNHCCSDDHCGSEHQIENQLAAVPPSIFSFQIYHEET